MNTNTLFVHADLDTDEGSTIHNVDIDWEDAHGIIIDLNHLAKDDIIINKIYKFYNIDRVKYSKYKITWQDNRFYVTISSRNNRIHTHLLYNKVNLS